MSIGRGAALFAAAFLTGTGVSAAAPATAANPAWTGNYSMVTYASQKAGTSSSARQQEPDFSAVFALTTACSTSACVATASGPASSNPTVPNPVRYSWNGRSWVSVYDWVWECSAGEEKPSEWSPARSWTSYTPMSDGTLRGSWRTDISTGGCRGTVVMPVVASPAQ